MLFSVTGAHAQSALDGLEIKANTVSRDFETRTVILEGDVKIGFGADQLSCQRASIDLRQQIVSAQGEVRLESEGQYIEGEKIIYNYRTKLAEIHQGYIQSGQVVFLGELIKKNSETEYYIRDAKFTSCATCPPAWSFSGSEIKAEMGGYASIKYPFLRIGDIPVLWLPRIWVPLKSERQSGVLVPSLDYSSVGGTALTLPIYWAISRSQDATYSAKTYAKRGVKHKFEYRYVLDDSSRGELNAAYLRDEAFTANGKASGDRETFNRGFLSYYHYYELPHNYIHRADLNVASDLRYPRDFSDEMAGHGDSALENSYSMTKNTKGQAFSVEATHYTNLLKTDAHATNDDAVHRMPELQYSLLDRELLDTGLRYKFDFNYTHFARRSFAYDDELAGGTLADREPDGAKTNAGFTFNAADGYDLIRTGHRFIFQPAVSYPFHIGRYLDVNPSVTFNETQYRFNVAPGVIEDEYNYERNATRRYLQTDLSLKTKYSAVYGSSDAFSTRYKHEIEPEILYSRIPYADRPNHLFFGDFENQPYSRRNEAISNADYRGTSGLQFDYRDRLFDKDLVTFTLNNYMIRKRFVGALPSYQRFMTFRLSQSYDFNVAENANSQPWSNINGLLDVRQDRFETHTTADFYPYSNVTNWSTRLKFMTTLRNYLELTYTDNWIVKADQTSVAGTRNQTYGTGIGLKSRALDLVGRTNFSLVTDELESWEYMAVLKPPGDCWSVRFGHKKTLGADTNFKFSLNFDFAGI